MKTFGCVVLFVLGVLMLLAMACVPIAVAYLNHISPEWLAVQWKDGDTPVGVTGMFVAIILFCGGIASIAFAICGLKDE